MYLLLAELHKCLTAKRRAHTHEYRNWLATIALMGFNCRKRTHRVQKLDCKLVRKKSNGQAPPSRVDKKCFRKMPPVSFSLWILFNFIFLFLIFFISCGEEAEEATQILQQRARRWAKRTPKVRLMQFLFVYFQFLPGHPLWFLSSLFSAIVVECTFIFYTHIFCAVFCALKNAFVSPVSTRKLCQNSKTVVFFFVGCCCCTC